MSLFNFGHRTSKMVLASAALLLGGVVVGAGCGGIDVSTLTGFCEAQATAECSFPIVQACYGSNDTSINDDTNSCIQVRSRADKCNPTNLPYNPSFADNCINTRANVYAGGSFDRAAYDTVIEACLPVFNRGGLEGSACTLDSDCDVGAELRCIVRVGGKGVCRVPRLAMGGESCKDSAVQCPAAQFCDAGFHCVQRGIEGEACGAGQPCGGGFRCNEVAQKCEKQFSNGQPCKLDSDCSGGFCLGINTGSGAAGACSSTYQLGFGSPTCLAFTR